MKRRRRTVLKSVVGPISLHQLWALLPGTRETVIPLFQTALRGPSPLSPAERELIYAYCCALHGCHYAYATHKACAIALGIKPQVFNAVLKGIDTAPVRPKLQPILRFARKIALASAAIEPEDVDPIYQSGWREKAVIDTIAVTSLAAWVSCLLNSFGTTGTDRELRVAGRRLARKGYVRKPS